MKTPILILLAALAVSAGSLATHRISRVTQEDDIREAVFRYQFTHNYSGLQQSANAYYLRCGMIKSYGVPPSQAFLQRFSGHKPIVKSVGDCVMEDGVKDRRKGKKGLIFEVLSIRWVAEDKVEVTGGYYEGPLSSSGETFSVIREHGHWVVKSSRLEWIS